MTHRCTVCGLRIPGYPEFGDHGKCPACARCNCGTEVPTVHAPGCGRSPEDKLRIAAHARRVAEHLDRMYGEWLPLVKQDAQRKGVTVGELVSKAVAEMAYQFALTSGVRSLVPEEVEA